MPNLEQRAVERWLTELRPDAAGSDWPPAIRAVEAEEDAPTWLAMLGAALDALAKDDPAKLAAALKGPPIRDDLSAVMAQLGAARTLRLLHWFSEIDLPDCHEIAAALMQGDDPARVALRATIEAVVQRAVLGRIFAPERIAALELACGAREAA